MFYENSLNYWHDANLNELDIEIDENANGEKIWRRQFG